MQFNCVIVDDDPSSIEILSDYISETKNLKLTNTYLNPLDALDQIDVDKNIDFLFLDVNMPQLSGIELGKLVRGKVKYLVYTTGHTQYAVDAFKVHADQFLLKPFGLNTFSRVVDKVLMHETRTRLEPVAKEQLSFIKGAERGGFLKIDFDSIHYIRAMEHYVSIYTDHTSHTTKATMKELEAALKDNTNFMRVHNSYIISKSSILRIEGHTIILKNNAVVPIGDKYKKTFFDYIASLTLKTKN